MVDRYVDDNGVRRLATADELAEINARETAWNNDAPNRKLEEIKQRNGHTSIDSTIRDILYKVDNKVTHIFIDDEFEKHFKFLDRTMKKAYSTEPYGGVPR